MNKGVELLLLRMESHPEEFIPQKSIRGRWYPLLSAVGITISPDGVIINDTMLPASFLSGEELNALAAKLKAIQAEAFTNAVMRTLTAPVATRVDDTVKLVMNAQVPAAGGTTPKKIMPLTDSGVDLTDATYKKLPCNYYIWISRPTTIRRTVYPN